MDYLHFHRNQWRVRRVVPPALVPIIGKATLLRSTGSDDFDRAQRIARPIIKEFAAVIDRAAGRRSSRVHVRHSQPERRSSEWYTPEWIFAGPIGLNATFDMDVASPGVAHVPWIPCRAHVTVDSLQKQWCGFIWCNPPYGLRNNMSAWLEKFCQHANGILLTSANSYTKWWQQTAGRVDVVLFIGRYVDFISPNRTTAARISFGSCLMGIGDKAVSVLQDASARGLGQIVVIPESKRAALT